MSFADLAATVATVLMAVFSIVSLILAIYKHERGSQSPVARALGVAAIALFFGFILGACASGSQLGELPSILQLLFFLASMSTIVLGSSGIYFSSIEPQKPFELKFSSQLHKR